LVVTSLVAGCSSAGGSSEALELTINSTRSCRVILCWEITRIQMGSLELARTHLALKTGMQSCAPFTRTQTPKF